MDLPLTTRWPYIVAHCRMMGSFPYYVTDQLRLAEQTNAPADAYSSDELPDGSVRWRRASELPERTPTSGLTYRERLEEAVGRYR